MDAIIIDIAVAVVAVVEWHPKPVNGKLHGLGGGSNCTLGPSAHMRQKMQSTRISVSLKWLLTISIPCTSTGPARTANQLMGYEKSTELIRDYKDDRLLINDFSI